MLKEHFDLLDTDPPEKILERLGERRLLALTLGLDVAGELHPLVARDRFQDAWAEFLADLASELPTIVLIEDLHWAEPPLLELIEWLRVRVEAPLLVVGTARPDLIERRPGWGKSDGASLSELEPLSQQESVILVGELLDAEAPPRLSELVLDRSEGNPFVVEELVGMLIDRGQLTREGGRWEVSESAAEIDVPDSVQALLAARIDLLAPADKEALQTAAVIGRVFWTGPVYELVTGEPDFHALEERDFIRLRSTSSITGQREYAIKHALTREVAYAGLPRARRARLHAGFATWLERLAEDSGDKHAPLLAHHYAEAVRPENADLAWSGEEAELARLRARAVLWLRRAAELAAGRYEIDDAVSLLERAAALETNAAAQVEIWRELGHANAVSYNGRGFEAAMQQCDRARRRRPDHRGPVLGAGLPDPRPCRHVGCRASAGPRRRVGSDVPSSSRTPDSESRAKALIARCYSDYDKSLELTSEARRIAEQLDDPVLRSYAYDVEGLRAFAGVRLRAMPTNGPAVASRSSARSETLTTRQDIYHFAIAPAVALGHLDEARRYTVSHEEITRGLSAHHRLHSVAADLMLEELLGNWEAVSRLQQRLEEAVAANVATPCVLHERSLLVCALASAHLGDEKEAHRLEQEAGTHAMTGYGTVSSTPRVQLALLRGDLAAVESLLGEPGVRRSNWAYLSSMATYLDGLAALGERALVEAEASRVMRPGTYLEPFALRA